MEYAPYLVIGLCGYASWYAITDLRRRLLETQAQLAGLGSHTSAVQSQLDQTGQLLKNVQRDLQSLKGQPSPSTKRAPASADFVVDRVREILADEVDLDEPTPQHARLPIAARSR